jgi:hypothetical protein
MIVRLAVAATVAAGLALSATGAQAAKPPVLDGKKTKVLTLKAVAGPQTHDADLPDTDLNFPDRLNCDKATCATLDFVYAPAKGVKTVGLAFEATWATPVLTDIDLYVGAVDRYGEATEVDGGHCGAGYGTHERVWLSKATFKPGKTYRVVAYFYRTAGETVTTKVTFNGANQIPSTVPAEADGVVYPINCGL